MSTIDDRIVKLRLDNDDFEKNASVSMNTLEKLQNALSFNKKDIDVGSKFDLSGISNSVDSIANRFSNLGIIGMTALQNITNSAINLAKSGIANVFEKIFQGGKKRALNIEQAKFQLQGLKVAWDDISEDIDYGVKGTAYGLDAAARAASQLVASGVEVGESMKTALRGISGVAAMTNAEYEEISPIFTTIAGQGRMMTMQLRQLENRGLNAAATIRDYFNSSTESMDQFYTLYTQHKKKNDADIQKGSKATEEAIRTMVTNGAIDFDIFSKAMDSAFGEHAKDANKTFEGSLRNVGAALSRIGAKIQTPKHEAFRRIYVSLIPVIDKISSKLDPLFKIWEDGLFKVADWISKILDNLKLDWIDVVIKAIETLYSNISSIGGAIAEAFREIFPQDLKKKSSNIANGFIDFITKFKMNEKTLNVIKNIFKGLFTVIKLVAGAFGLLGKAIKIVFNFFKKLSPKIKSVVSKFKEFVESIKKYIKTHKIVEKVNIRMRKAFETLKAIFEKAKDKISEAITKIKEFFKKIFDPNSEESKRIKQYGENIKESLYKIKQFFIKAKDDFEDVFSKIKEIFGKMFNKKSDEMKNIDEYGDNVESGLGKIQKHFEKFRDTMSNISGGLKSVFAVIWDKLKEILTPVKDKFKESLKEVDLINLIQNAVSVGLIVSITKLAKSIKKAVDSVGGIVNGIASFFNSASSLMKAQEKDMKSKKILRIAESLLILAAAMFIISKIPTEELKKAGVALGVALGAILGAAALLALIEKINSKSEKDIGFGKMALFIIGLAFAINKIAKSAAMLAKMDPTSVANAISALIGTIGYLSISLALIGKLGISDKEIYAFSLSLLSFAGAIYVITLAFQVFDTIKNIENGVLALTASLLAFTVMLGVINHAGINNTQLITFAGAILVFAGSMYVLALALEKMGKMELADIGKGFIAIFGAFGGLLLIAGLFSSFIPAFAAFAGVILVLAGSFYLTAAAFSLFTDTLIKFRDAGESAVPTLVSFITAFCEKLPMIGEALGMFFVMIIVTFFKNIELMTEAFSLSLISLLETILVFIPIITELGVKILLAFLWGINEYMAEITQVGTELIVNFIVGMLNGLAETAGELVDATYNYIIAWINAIADGMDEHTDEVLDAIDRLWEATKKAALKIWDRASTKVKEWGTKLIEKFKEKAHEAWQKVLKWFEGLPQEVKDSILAFGSTLRDLGSEIMEHIKEGLLGGLKKVTDAATNIGKSILDAFKGKKALDERSPSHAAEKIGEYADEGLVKGLEKGKKRIDSVVNDISSDVKEGLSDVPDRLHSVFESIKDNLNVNDNPVITPVVDLSNVEKSGSEINSIFGSSSVSGGFLSSILPTRNLASGIGAYREDLLSDPKMASSLRNFTFIQNNNSPKALSRIDIYRQTRNQLEDFKELGMFDKTG